MLPLVCVKSFILEYTGRDTARTFYVFFSGELPDYFNLQGFRIISIIIYGSSLVSVIPNYLEEIET